MSREKGVKDRAAAFTLGKNVVKVIKPSRVFIRAWFYVKIEVFYLRSGASLASLWVINAPVSTQTLWLQKTTI